MTARKSNSPRNDRPPKLTGKKSLGQNFLVNEHIVDKIIGEFAPSREDVVLEIGPGHGALTRKLVTRVDRLYALEFDNQLAAELRKRFAGFENFIVLEDDALAVDFRQMVHEGDELRLIANLPYNISTAILQRLFEHAGVFSDCVLMFQREVAERITAPPGTKDRGYLTVLTEAYFSVEILFDVPPNAFQPMPKVWSSVVRLIPKREILPDPAAFRALLGAAFAHKRKTIQNNLRVRFARTENVLEESGIQPARRAETLELHEWEGLLRTAIDAGWFD